ncbi:DUF4180 domain-containing protein [Propioniciclava coleopterorum]|uniref:DUF4180 domain-containing protein n=1 Tax=Propioniciclava coleopterorum TaxID=2714937 RepID=A0A6G7Y7C5_9ACTN|nr:DUF4180 domain-containing protein [Propioniciclava coleopterorum]QIK72517.1 DUF4180 domain-containing protein [Propioniciclava coleopterorum]
MGDGTDDRVVESGGRRLLVCADDGPVIASTQDALDLIGAAFRNAEFVVVPAHRLDASFFRLGTGFAGDVMQKFVNYRVKLVVLGDIDAHLERSDAFRGLVAESNDADHIWFLPDLDALDARLAGAA